MEEIRLLKWENQNSVYAFALKHLDIYEQYYNVAIQNKQLRVLPRIKPVTDLDANELKLKAKQRREHNWKYENCYFAFRMV